MANFNLNDYETVDQRLRRFKKDWPDSQVHTEYEVEGPLGKSRWVVRAAIWKKPGYERPDSTGLAFEMDGQGMANKTSALENCETSALGRALANLGYSGDKRATREEMAKVEREEGRQRQEAQSRKVWLAQQADKLLEAEKAGDADAIRRVKEWAAQKSIRELVEMAQSTLERMDSAAAEQMVRDELGGEVVQGELVNQ